MVKKRTRRLLDLNVEDETDYEADNLTNGSSLSKNDKQINNNNVPTKIPGNFKMPNFRKSHDNCRIGVNKNNNVNKNNIRLIL